MKTKKRSGVELRTPAVIVTVQALDLAELTAQNRRAMANYLREVARQLDGEETLRSGKRLRFRVMWDSLGIYGDTQLPRARR